MAISGKLDADKFWGAIKNTEELFPNVRPNIYKSIEILEADGKTRQVTLREGSIVKIVKEKVDAVDDENRTLLYSVIDGDLLNSFKHLNGFLMK